MNNNSKNTSEALQGLQAAAEYAARPPQPLEGARRSERVQPISESYAKATNQGNHFSNPDSYSESFSHIWLDPIFLQWIQNPTVKG